VVEYLWLTECNDSPLCHTFGSVGTHIEMHYGSYLASVQPNADSGKNLGRKLHFTQDYSTNLTELLNESGAWMVSASISTLLLHFSICFRLLID
jgi:hypothetical protein